MRPKNKERYTLDMSRSKRIDDYTLIVPHQRNPGSGESGGFWKNEMRGWGRAIASVTGELLETVPDAMKEVNRMKRRRR